MEAHQPLITQLIQHYRKMTRGPYGAAKALQEARQASETSLERILQDESESAWRAYYAARKPTEQQRGFSGKAELIRLLDDLRTNSIEQQRAFAKQLALAMETEEVNGSRQGAKRRRKYSTRNLFWLAKDDPRYHHHPKPHRSFGTTDHDDNDEQHRHGLHRCRALRLRTNTLPISCAKQRIRRSPSEPGTRTVP